MKVIQKYKYIIAILILCIGVKICPAVTKAAENNQGQVVRVGYLEYPGFIEKGEDGNYSGYAVEYLDALSKYTGDTYEYVEASWADCLDMLKKHEIDLVCNAQFSEERALEYDYAKQSFGTIIGCMYASNQLKDIYYEDFENFNGKTIGFLERSLNADQFRIYEQTNEFQCEEKYYRTIDDLLTALSQNEVEFIGVNSICNVTGYDLVANYHYDNCYFMSYKDSEIIAKLNQVMPQLTAEQPDLRSDLYKKYYGNSVVDSSTHFTREEAEYIKKAPTLRVAVYADSKPMAFEDEKTRILEGIEPAILDVISEVSGLKFEYVSLSNSNTSYDYEYFRQNNIQLISGIDRNQYNENIDGLVLSNVYFSDKKVLVGRNGESIHVNDSIRIAIDASSGTLSYLVQEAFPNAEITTYASITESMNAVLQNKADATIFNEYMVNEELRRPIYEKLAVVPNAVISENMSLSPVIYSDGEQQRSEFLSDERLISILNKTIASMNEEKINEIVRENTIGIQGSLDIKDFLYKYRASITILIIALFIILVLLWINSRNQEKAVEKLELKNKQLANAVTAADYANKAKSDFLARMSHEIRTPMNAVIGETTLAKKNIQDTDKVVSCLDKVMISSKHLLNLINDILDMSAIENNKIKIANVQFDLKEIVNTVTTIYYAQCRNKGIKFESKLEDISKEIVIGDQLRIQQVILNLLSNALKFTNRGGVVVFSLAEEILEERKILLHIVIQDNGCGISEEYMQRIFKPFEQENALTAKEHGGSGLGLSISKNLVELMKGTIRVESKAGEGTSVFVDIPVMEAKSQQKMESDELSNLRSIIIDDDPSALEYSASILDHIGLSYDTANSGEEALRLITKARNDKQMYDLCLVDWKMGKMDGLQLTRRIRKTCGEKPIVVVASAYDLNEISEEISEAGVDACITKPLFQSTVFNILMSLSQGKLVRNTAKPEEYDFSGKRVLLVDDTELNREIAKELLLMVNFQVDTANDGKEALEIFEKSEPGTYSVILMDVQMPVMNGYESTVAIRKCSHPEAKEVCIIAMTANAFAEDIAKSLEAGMDDHISKPIDTELMYEVLSRYL